MLRRTLQRVGYEVTEARDGKEGLKKYREETPRVVVTDLFMPEEEGLETIMELRRQFPDAQIIAVSGGCRVSPTGLLSVAQKLGAARTIEKSEGATKILAAVKELMTS